jgi:hypothetical protein
MSYTGKNPRFETTILTDQDVSSVSNPAAGSHKLVNRNGSLLMRNSAGAETSVAAGQSVLTVTDDNYTVLDNDGYTTILFDTGDTGRQLTLPTVAANANRVITVKKIDSGTGIVTIDGENSETIDAALTQILVSQYDHITVQANAAGTAWFIVGGKRVEYAYNTSSNTTTSDTTSFANGITGAQIQDITATLNRRVRFRTDIGPRDELDILFVNGSDQTKWVKPGSVVLSGIIGNLEFDNASNDVCGVGFNTNASLPATDIDVRFGKDKNSAGDTWSAGTDGTGVLWVVRKITYW